MRFLLLALCFLVPQAQAAAPKTKAVSSSRLICKTGPEKRAPGQPLKLFFNYNVPFTFEPEDPTVPYGRQTMLLAARPIVQLYFERSPLPAGENGEQLQPMQCAFAKRPIRASEPGQVQIVLAQGSLNWISQAIGQKNHDRALMIPPGDWSFAQQYERVFTLDLDDPKNFVTSQLPN